MSGKMLIHQRFIFETLYIRKENDYKLNVLLFSITYVKKIKAVPIGQLF